MAEIEKSYKGLRELCIKEKVMKSNRPELVMFLAKREDGDLSSIAKRSDCYNSAHSNHKMGNPTKHRVENRRTAYDANQHRGTFKGNTGLSRP